MSVTLDTYNQIKQQYPGYLLFYRIGDYYEAFEHDAEVVAEACNLHLASRVLGDQRVKMTGVPYHAVHTTATKLVEAGHKVAVAESDGTAHHVIDARGN